MPTGESSKWGSALREDPSQPCPVPPTMVKVKCSARILGAKTSILVDGVVTEANVCARGHKVHSGTKQIINISSKIF